MATYNDTAELRQALTSDNPDRRAEAYGAVYEADIEPSAVLADNPPEDDLRKAGVIPEEETRETREDREQKLLDELKQANKHLAEIASNTGGA